MVTRQRKKYITAWYLLGAVMVLVIVFCALLLLRVPQDGAAHSPTLPDSDESTGTPTPPSSGETDGSDTSPSDTPDLTGIPFTLLEFMEKNPEARDFVLNYPQKKDSSPTADLSEHLNSESVPLLIQWDERWGYTRYAGELMGLSGCGPTCLSMVCIYLLNDAKYTPKYVAEFAEENGYSSYGNGSSWTLISEGGKKLGLDVVEITPDADRIIRNLEYGNPIICVVGPGDFTTTGHYIVLTGYSDGMVSVNDPNSRERSAQLWDLTSVISQIRNLWACRL